MKGDIKLTWKDVVKEALSKIGDSGHLEDINSQIEGHWKTETNPTWRDTVRRTLAQYSIFYQEEKGSGHTSTKSLSISNINNKTYGLFDQHRLEG
ncbi:MAG: hypothetical protein O8C66_00200 [Candidatus Methanoperedens sp.]|nr:hypothetical protein [Candidatus Methanoperedens sp.]MCZ7368911.1 hypothetical protein [Candidatus Methanoperedens sp.]